ncbi:hypothetical protein EDD66_10845 [Mobilisporobacter senegalensis]|uniref:Uncharacterized protein n=1 Tax=Mobilisporobacter senegalensis TaxID=1329262 RepID=A0A3N1XHZ5_9FIRM|nr:hypothetical protein [Mobilisporobacter senegalensis]ROR26323.1 hypothetical protein EDD66_10845 [Mobilisporobacter senegalensis]
MKQENMWKQFEKTGSISDYLNFVACTKEEGHATYVEEGGQSGNTSEGDWFGSNDYASWRL